MTEVNSEQLAEMLIDRQITAAKVVAEVLGEGDIALPALGEKWMPVVLALRGLPEALQKSLGGAILNKFLSITSSRSLEDYCIDNIVAAINDATNVVHQSMIAEQQRAGRLLRPA